ncbi:uncharacterized protein FIBRA_08897 [Fibroporia radiculosa]|uniref:General transcription and DNA repair factor IIH subunit TFB5 n=1 Tax=Fibroporia radiculosa TaxID=599839 RepID=J4GIG8_9APHY|nr:uncharacterized protein FIBRA_08897 [Fibroporia radiculosa]CCM06618.1 predicted protein [Fibroporia radiculosa]
MKAIKGVLLTWFVYANRYIVSGAWLADLSVAPVKQILLTLNEKESFIIEDLDDHHVVIKADEEWRVRRELEAELEKNTYSLE